MKLSLADAWNPWVFYGASQGEEVTGVVSVGLGGMLRKVQARAPRMSRSRSSLTMALICFSLKISSSCLACGFLFVSSFSGKATMLPHGHNSWDTTIQREFSL